MAITDRRQFSPVYYVPYRSSGGNCTSYHSAGHTIRAASRLRAPVIIAARAGRGPFFRGGRRTRQIILVPLTGDDSRVLSPVPPRVGVIACREYNKAVPMGIAAEPHRADIAMRAMRRTQFLSILAHNQGRTRRCFGGVGHVDVFRQFGCRRKSFLRSKWAIEHDVRACATTYPLDAGSRVQVPLGFNEEEVGRR